ncbi:mediator of RNA polymerase II transcription subunit 4 [Microbacterium timonense]|uniref:hypothetical protein n=1 Tax=Microbacterium timonense TaxID=2086576 RepID=UPI000D10F6FF|nr:hypothetical protein [Microbacterium timonense]
MSDGTGNPDAYNRIQVARHALAHFVREAYTSRQFVMPESQAAHDKARAGSDHIPNRLVEGFIASTADHLKAWLRASEPPAGETSPLLHLYADYTLWRAILESLASGIWLLAPSPSDERIRRGVILALYEWKATGPVERPGRPADEAATRTQTELHGIIERVCNRMGWPVTDLDQRRFGPTQIIRGAQQHLGSDGRDLFYWWTICSRSAHAQSLTALLRARRTHFDTPHGGAVDVETDEALVAELVEFAVGTLNSFASLTRERGLLRVSRE